MKRANQAAPGKGAIPSCPMPDAPQGWCLMLVFELRLFLFLVWLVSWMERFILKKL